MPKRNSSDDDTAEIKAMFVEIKGSNATIQETLKAIATTFKPTVVQQILPSPQRQNDVLPSDVSAEDTIDLEELSPEEPTTRQKTRAGTRRNPRPPKPVDIDIASGEMPLKTYVQQRGPKSHLEKYMLLTSWLQKYRGQEQAFIITPNRAARGPDEVEHGNALSGVGLVCVLSGERD